MKRPCNGLHLIRYTQRACIVPDSYHIHHQQPHPYLTYLSWLRTHIEHSCSLLDPHLFPTPPIHRHCATHWGHGKWEITTDLSKRLRFKNLEVGGFKEISKPERPSGWVGLKYRQRTMGHPQGISANAASLELLGYAGQHWSSCRQVHCWLLPSLGSCNSIFWYGKQALGEEAFKSDPAQVLQVLCPTYIVSSAELTCLQPQGGNKGQ